MRCNICKICRPHPENPVQCIYGGPFYCYVPADMNQDIDRRQYYTIGVDGTHIPYRPETVLKSP